MGSFSGDKLRVSLDASLKDLGCPVGSQLAWRSIAHGQIDIFYLHFPDRQTPFDHALEVLDQLHKEGKYKQLGLSNFTAEETKQMCEVSAEVGRVHVSSLPCAT